MKIKGEHNGEGRTSKLYDIKIWARDRSEKIKAHKTIDREQGRFTMEIRQEWEQIRYPVHNLSWFEEE